MEAMNEPTLTDSKEAHAARTMVKLLQREDGLKAALGKSNSSSVLLLLLLLPPPLLPLLLDCQLTCLFACLLAYFIACVRACELSCLLLLLQGDCLCYVFSYLLCTIVQI